MREGWSSTALKNVCTVDKAKHSGTTLPYVGLEHIESGTGKFIGSLAPAMVKSTTFSFTASHVLYGRLRPYLNKVLLPEFDGHCSSEIFPLRVESSLDRRFLYYWLTWEPVVKEIDSTSTGARMPRANINKLLEFELPLPSLPEQKRIVAILDEAFAGIAIAVANTEKNLANARELFESYLNAVFSRREEGWIDGPLKEFSKCVSTGPFGSMLHKSDYVSVGVPLVNPINMVDGKIQPDVRKMISLETRERLQSYVLQAGDIVIARRGEIGRCAVVTKEQSGWVCGTGCFFVRPENTIDSDFLAYMLRSARYRLELERLSSGATMLNLSNAALSNLGVSVPKLAQQRKMVDQVSELLVQCQEVQSIYRSKLHALSELKQSMLQKAFSGELTAGPVSLNDALKEELVT
ncbi:restriction endonuclease subunit S [Ectothiorhodospira lacustris]|uniref:restriction endonuclease subunit S n=1 Tax=Ectothiorhodospira lacustris TaxID=2899127 RepID=UPI001EE839B8|nr:restriction endonuclease subunit S [Ectothiorhodospira lacustris]MCG5509128.1 restriction endonuclease subunit S [Ectothiorhodospira lacustris]MCG5520919.1 restriction endonuclease subunit S [Ectothiorhodospira lacustris]